MRSLDHSSFTDWSNRALEPDAEAFTDGLDCFRRFVDTGLAHVELETGGARTATEVKGALCLDRALYRHTSNRPQLPPVQASQVRAPLSR